MQVDEAVKDRRWDSRLSTVTAMAALSAAGLYFVGWQYKQSLALTFGLAGYPGDLSFQGTVATGVSVFDSRITVLVAVAFALVRLVQVVLDNIAPGLTLLLNAVRRKRINAVRVARQLRAEYNSKQEIDEDQLVRLEKQTSRLQWQATLLLRMTKLAKHSTFVALTMIAGLALTTLLILFYAGHLVAGMDARAIRIQAGGTCDGCFIFDAKPTKVIGVPLFQSGDTIYVQGREGLALIGLGKLRSIRPYGKAPAKALRLPRR